MPWVKFWDRSTNPPLLDGQVRWNEHDVNGHKVIDIPKMVRKSSSPLTTAEKEEYKKGPYADWNDERRKT